jgi:hypothetical protein
MPDNAITFDSATAAILTHAAERQGMSLDEYVRKAALSQAEMDLTTEELTNERLLRIAAKNPPPQSWFDEDEDLFSVEP